jgi:hypothetical protein
VKLLSKESDLVQGDFASLDAAAIGGLPRRAENGLLIDRVQLAVEPKTRI